jgi:hypothetical protein
MDTKEIILPEGWIVDKVEDGKVILKEKEKEDDFAKFDTWEKCYYHTFYDHGLSHINKYGCTIPENSYIPDDKYGMFPSKYSKAIQNLFKLLVCYKAWIGKWEPAMNGSTYFVIVTDYGKLAKKQYVSANAILSFPTEEMRDKFYVTFLPLLEKAKPLL